MSVGSWTSVVVALANNVRRRCINARSRLVDHLIHPCIFSQPLNNILDMTIGNTTKARHAHRVSSPMPKPTGTAMMLAVFGLNRDAIYSEHEVKKNYEFTYQVHGLAFRKYFRKK